MELFCLVSLDSSLLVAVCAFLELLFFAMNCYYKLFFAAINRHSPLLTAMNGQPHHQERQDST